VAVPDILKSTRKGKKSPVKIGYGEQWHMPVEQLAEAPLTSSSPPLPVLPSSVVPSIKIEAAHAWPSLKLGELWAYRELIYFLVWRDIKVRYKQTVLGAGWALIQPLFTMLLFSFFFGRLAKVPSDNIPYPLFTFTALVPWMYFANSFGQASNSLVSNSSLIKKVYFPRLAIPIAKVLSALVDFALGFLLLIGMTFYYGIHPTIRIVWVIPFLLLAMITSLGSSFWLSALNVRIRDVEHTLPFLVQIWLYATPIAYPSSLLSPKLRMLYGINPMVGVVEGFRWALVGAKTPPGPMFALSAVAAVIILISGAYWFRRLEKTFADVL
jgi:lipopolysaccharide transport system permease protein